ncbi:MAG: hypothetical protein R3245_06145, partial [Kiloniellales bacterium]|nr:hypothetical protein [Kiloniellales bacterium]
MSFNRSLLHFPRQFFSSLSIVRVPLAVAVLASLALSVPPQTREIYRVLAHDLQTDWPQILAAYVSLFLAAWILWNTARYLTQLRADDRVSREQADSLVRTWLPRLIGAAPIVACGFGILFARQGLIHAAVHAGKVLEVLDGDFRIEQLKTLKAELETHSEILQIGSYVCFGVAAALFVLWAILPTRDESAKRLSPLWSLFSSERRFVFYVLAVTAAIIFSLMLLEVPQAFGALAIFNVFVVCLALLLTLLDVLGRRFGIPFITILVIVAVVASVFELNNNHGIRTWTTSEAFEKPHVTRAFDAWYNSRNDRHFYEELNQPYPVYIVAARGGGLYAAYHTAKFLARLQDQ